MTFERAVRCLSRPPQNLPVARSGAGTPNGPLFAATGSAAVGTQGVWQRVEVSASRAGAGLNAGTVTTGREGWLWLPPAQEPLAHDADGNLTSSARWTLQWDAENRLAVAEEKDIARPPGAPARVRLEMAYDSQSRRVRKVVKQWNPSSGSFELFSDTRFVYDGWNLIAELRMNQESGILDLESTHAWGLDLSGTMTGAGGVGGLLLTALHSTTQTTANNGQPQPTSVLAPCYDGNGNILAYLDCATGQLAARYEYDPFGQLTAKDEAPAVAGRLHHQFSTKYADAETGFVYYGYRYYWPELGRWPSRDPMGEEGHELMKAAMLPASTDGLDEIGIYDSVVQPSPEFHASMSGVLPGGLNRYGFCYNDPINYVDVLGENAALGAAARWAAARAAAAAAAKKAAKKIAECEAIHQAYKAVEKNCRGCNANTPGAEANKQCACWSAVLAGRSLYIMKKCDYILPGSIARGSKGVCRP